MRVENWNPNKFDAEFENVAVERLVDAAKVVANYAKRTCPFGTVSRPMYKTGPYKNQPWTARDAGQLKRSVRVVQKLSKAGKPLQRRRDVRVYAGNYLAYYAAIVEYYHAFLRPALSATMSSVKSIIGAK